MSNDKTTPIDHAPTAPMVTVYIPCRNYGRFLPQAIDSVLSQSFTNWELFLVDEASEDDSLEIMNAYAAKHAEKIKVIAHETPMGLQRTANEVLALARGRYFIRLDGDDWFDEAALLVLVNRLEADDRFGIAWGNYYYTDADGRIMGVEQANRPGTERPSLLSAPHGACTMVRTRALKAVGGYSEDVTAQDGWELWHKLQNQVDAVSVSTAIFYYRQHGSSLSRDAGRLLEARTRIFDKLASQLDGSYEPSALAVIGVREDYPGKPGVPYQKIGDVSLLEHALHNTQKACRINQVMISSKSEQVLSFAEKLETTDAVAPHMRRLRQTKEQDASLPVQEILLDAGHHYHECHGHFPDILIFCSIHSINRTATHVDKALNVLRINRFDSVVSVQEERSVLFANNENGLKMVNPGRLQALSFDREKFYRFNGALIAVWWDALEAGTLFGDRVGFIEMSEEESQQYIQASERYAQSFSS